VFEEQGLQSGGLDADPHLAVLGGFDPLLPDLAFPLALPQVQTESLCLLLEFAEDSQAQLLPQKGEFLAEGG
jgi:hypothetical protein